MITRDIQPLIEKLFTASKDEKPTSEKILSEIKEITNKIPKFNGLIKQAAVFVQEMKKSIPEIALEIPQEISIDKHDTKGFTPLIYAALNNHREIIQELIAAGAGLNIKNQYGDTALISSTIKGHREIAQTLIKAKAELNIQGEYGNTALIWASYKGHESIARALIETGATTNIRSNEGNTALDVAIEGKHLSIVSFLLDMGAMGDPNTLYQFLKNCDQRDPDVSSSLQILYREQTKLREAHSKEKNHDGRLNDNDYEELEIYLVKLTNLEKFRICNDEKRQEVFNLIDENIHIEKNKKMPEEIINLMTAYYYPSLSGLSIFKPSGIDKLFANNFVSALRKRK